jgi:hypothetical protein
LNRVPNDFVQVRPFLRTLAVAGAIAPDGASEDQGRRRRLVRVEPNKARCRFHGGLLAEVNLRLTPLMCAILLRDDFTQVRRRD